MNNSRARTNGRAAADRGEAMFEHYLPVPIYDHLPDIYLAVASVLTVATLPPIKWVSIAALLLATAVTARQRQAFLEATRARTGSIEAKARPCSDGAFEIPTYSDDFAHRVRGKRRS